MNITYHFPSKHTITAWRTIYNWYKNAFMDLWHNFYTYSIGDDLEKMLENSQSDIFMTSLSTYHLSQLDIDILKKYKQKWMKIAFYLPMWTSPLSITRINEAWSLKNNKILLDFISSWLWDIYYCPFEQSDLRMEWFTEHTWYKYHTIPLAVDKIICDKAKYNENFIADISYIWTNLPEKRVFFEEQVYPLKKKYKLKLYGQDRTTLDWTLWRIQKAWQYFNIPLIRSIRKPKLQLSDEYDIYKTTKISINVHEDYQKKYGWDCNERTFKILACGWFEITDDVSCIHKYLKDWEEIIIAKNKQDRFEKIEYYMNHPKERENISLAWQKKVMENHTYHNRVKQILNIYNDI